MQAAGQYGEVQQYLASRVGASHGHMFNLSHEMSLSSSASTAPAAQSQQAHGHGLSLSHSPAHSLASQSQSQSQTVSLTQPLLQQQQHGQSNFSVSMASATPITTSAGPSTSIAPQQTQALQSAAQQLQADIKQHQQQQLLQTQQTKADDVRPQEATNTQQKSTIIADPIQQIKPNEPPTEPRGNAAISVQSVQNRMAIVIPEKTTKEETSGDGDEMDEEGERVAGVNRWPREEALALLKIRSEMDAVFRDSSLKGPLWEEISRKLAEMGYQRSAKKCKEKFENVHKYYKRTKEGKTGRQDGKSYRFFAQLEALYGKAGASDQQHHNLQYHPHYHQHHQQNQLHHMSTSSALMNLNSYKSPNPHAVTNLNAVGSTNIHSHSVGLLPKLSADNPGSAVGFNIAAPSHTIIGNAATSSNISGPLPLASFPAYNPISASTATAAAAAAATNAHIARTLERVESMNHERQNNPSVQNYLDSDESEDDYDNEDEDDDHDDDEDDESTEPAARESKVPAATQNPPKSGGKKRKRKSLKEYMVLFEKIMKQVLDKQEQMQEKFLEALERRDHDRMIREEAWKRQEMARLNREHDVRAAERALAASRDASLVAFLQKITGQTVTLPHQSHSTQMNSHYSNSNAIVPADYMQNDSNADRDPYDPSGSKRWPKPEVLALIKLRTSLEQKFHEPGSKAVLWEEISSGMDSQGYSRPAKRCKEKWENINKYFKKAKESNKKRPENAKTCPYFHHLNALYKEGLLLGGGGGGASSISSKHLLIADKSEDVLEQGVNTSKFSGSGEESSHLHDVGASAAVPSPKNMSVSIAAMPITTQPPIANAATMMRISSPPPEMSTSTMFTLMTSSATSDAKMHVFMASDRGDKKQPVIDLSAACTAPTSQAAAAFNLDHAISSSRSLPSGPTPITKQSEQQPQT